MEKPSPRISLDTCEDMFDKLKWDREQLVKDWNTYSAFNFVLTAYHLYTDWIPSAGTSEQRRRKGALPENGKLLFSALRDLTNASKHWKLDSPSKKKQVVESVSGPEIGDWYAMLVTGPVIYIDLKHTSLSITQIADLTMQCFKWLILGDEGIAKADLTRQLDIAFKPLLRPSA